MKKIIVLISVFVKFECLAQQKVSADTLARIIEDISNSSVFIAYNYIETLHLDQKALTLCNNLSNSLASAMINELNNKEKALVFHIILSKSTEPSNAKFKGTYHYAGGKIDYTTYSFNNFSWEQDSSGVIKIEKETVENIAKYWNDKKGKFLIFHRCN